MPSAHSPLDLPSPPPSSLQADDEKSKETKKRTHAFHHSSSHASHKKDTPQRRQDQEEEEEETPTTTTTQLQAPLKRGLSSPNPGMKRRRCFAGQSSSSSSSQTVGGTGASQEIHAPLIQKETDLFHSPHEEKEEAFHGDADSRNPSASSSAPPFAPLDLPPLQMDGVPLSQRRDLSQSLSRHSSSSSCADGPIASSSSSALKPRSSRFPPHGNEEEEGEGEEEETQHGEEVSRDPPPRQGDEEDDKIHNDIKMKKKRKRRDSNTSGSFLQVSLPPVSPSLILTDWYQLAMLYANWREGRHLQKAVFEGFFRKAPFHGEYAVMAGVKQMIDFISHMRFTEDEIDFF
ncbi:nicotinate phosphoribosyltransferase, partial [Cystoisospora suis]